MQVEVVVISNKFPGMSGRLRQADRDIRMKGALDIYATSIPYTPVDTGALRANVTTNETGVYWHQEYSVFQEFGTVRGITPKLFASHAADVVFPQMIAAYQQLEGRLV